MSEKHYSEHDRDDVSFLEWKLDCGLRWMSRNDEDVYDWPAYPWREWYDRGLTVDRAVDEANILLFGHAQGG